MFNLKEEIEKGEILIDNENMNRLKNLRKEKNLRQLDVSNFLNIPNQTYCRYELGKSEMDYSTLLKLSKFYKVSINFILGEKEENLIIITKEEFENLKIIKELANIINKIDERNKYNKE